MTVTGRSRIEEVEDELRRSPRTWLVTGAAGFIGSNLVERLLKLGQRVVGLDNFATGRQENLLGLCGAEGASRFRFVVGDICDPDRCIDALAGVDVLLHQAALGSVPRSIADPLASHRANVDGFLTLLLAARDAGVRRFVYAASSSTYGDHPALPKVEDQIGGRSRPTRSPSTWASCTRGSSTACTGWRRSACATSTSSGGGRIPRGRTRR